MLLLGSMNSQIPLYVILWNQVFILKSSWANTHHVLLLFGIYLIPHCYYFCNFMIIYIALTISIVLLVLYYKFFCLSYDKLKFHYIRFQSFNKFLSSISDNGLTQKCIKRAFCVNKTKKEHVRKF